MPSYHGRAVLSPLDNSIGINISAQEWTLDGRHHSVSFLFLDAGDHYEPQYDITNDIPNWLSKDDVQQALTLAIEYLGIDKTGRLTID